METIHQKFEGQKEQMTLEEFQSEMTSFVGREVSGEEESGHFLAPNKEVREANIDFDASKLTEEDHEIWEKIKAKTITAKEFHEYASAVSALDEKDPSRSSRVIFSEFAGNKAMPAIFEKAMASRKKV